MLGPQQPGQPQPVQPAMDAANQRLQFTGGSPPHTQPPTHPNKPPPNRSRPHTTTTTTTHAHQPPLLLLCRPQLQWPRASFDCQRRLAGNLATLRSWMLGVSPPALAATSGRRRAHKGQGHNACTRCGGRGASARSFGVASTNGGVCAALHAHPRRVLLPACCSSHAWHRLWDADSRPSGRLQLLAQLSCTSPPLHAPGLA